jgi:hypothetical protein
VGSQGSELKGIKNKIKKSSVPRLQPRSRRRYRDSRQNLRTSASDTVSCYIRGIAHLLQTYRDSRQNLRTSASDTVSCYIPALRTYYNRFHCCGSGSELSHLRGGSWNFFLSAKGEFSFGAWKCFIQA